MRHTTIATTFLLLIAAAISPQARGSDVREVEWIRMCQVAGDHGILLTTATGEKVEGYCIGVNVDELRVNTKDKGIVKIARKSLAKIQLYRAKDHQLRALGRDMHKGLKTGFDLLFSPMAPAGIVAVPGTLAWGAISAPFCILGDLHSQLAGKQEIKPI